MRALAFALLLLTVACDSESPAPPAAAVDPDRPCAFATSDEIASAVGGRAGKRSQVEGHDLTSLCHYEVGPPYSAVGLYVEDGVSDEAFRKRMEEDPRNTHPLEGAGALAFTRGGVDVSVWDEGRVVTASVQHFGNAADTSDALQELGELIASKL